MASKLIMPKIFIPKRHQAHAREEELRDMVAEQASESGMIPLRIKCPDCQRVFTLYIRDFDQELHMLLGQACQYCKYFIKESDDPEKLLLDFREIRALLKKGGKKTV